MAVASCKDQNVHCKPWATTYDYCDKSSVYHGYMKQSCRESCGWCPTQRSTTVITTVPSAVHPTQKSTATKTITFSRRPEERPTIATELHSNIKPANLTQLPPSASLSTLSSNGKSSNTTSSTPRLPGKTFLSVEAIVGASAGSVLLLICIIIAFICLKRRRNRWKSKEISTSSNAATNDNGSLLPKHRAQAEDIEMKGNPSSGLTPRQTKSKPLKSRKPKPIVNHSPADNEEHYATPQMPSHEPSSRIKNDTEPKQQVPHEYMVAIPDGSHYQRLTVKHQNPVYQPLTKDYENVLKAGSEGRQIYENSAEFKR